MEERFHITAIYAFFPVADGELEKLRGELEADGNGLGLKGLIILAREGLNATVCGSEEGIGTLKRLLRERFPQVDWNFKDSLSERMSYKRFRVQVREEIVTAGFLLEEGKAKANNYLSPEEWHREVEKGEAIVLDTRNDYEVSIGKFRGAVDPGLDHFSDFPEYLRNSGLPRDKKLLIYCTGGIRCEKAAVQMREQGFENVLQLQGGILKYLEEFPRGTFEGECFVFDHRVAVDSELRPSSTYRLCPHCGQPAKEEVHCAHCERPTKVCEQCKSQRTLFACSLNCDYHAQRKFEASRA